MIFWLDAQLSPKLAPWIKKEFLIECHAVRDLNLINASDTYIFDAARSAHAVVITKDKDFRDLVFQRGIPPQILWITCGNTSNKKTQEILKKSMKTIIEMLNKGEALVEVTDVI